MIAGCIIFNIKLMLKYKTAINNYNIWNCVMKIIKLDMLFWVNFSCE